jgi:hypothetical protein
MLAALALTACGGDAGSPGGTGTASVVAAPSGTAPAQTPVPSATAASTATQAATAAASPGGESGVEGVVLAGPTCPVERVDSPCPERPVALTLGFYTPTHSTPAVPVATATSDASGRFRVALPPGTYVVQRACGPQACTQFPFVKPLTVEVQPGRYTSLTINADTGIR